MSGFVRVGTPGEGLAVARIQVACFAELGVTLDQSVATHAWEAACSSPPSPEHRVLVAVAPVIVGFAAVAPLADPDDAGDPSITVGRLLALHVTPGSRGQGHGSRLTAATLEHAGRHGWHGLSCWVPSSDPATAAWLEGAGWERDGAVRELEGDDDEGRVQEVRLRVWL